MIREIRSRIAPALSRNDPEKFAQPILEELYNFGASSSLSSLDIQCKSDKEMLHVIRGWQIAEDFDMDLERRSLEVSINT